MTGSGLALSPSEKQCSSLEVCQIPKRRTCLAWECPLMKRGRPFDPPTPQPAAHLSGCPSIFRPTQPTNGLPMMHHPLPLLCVAWRRHGSAYQMAALLRQQIVCFPWDWVKAGCWMRPSLQPSATPTLPAVLLCCLFFPLGRERSMRSVCVCMNVHVCACVYVCVCMRVTVCVRIVYVCVHKCV